jgi:hypothetical protein
LLQKSLVGIAVSGHANGHKFVASRIAAVYPEREDIIAVLEEFDQGQGVRRVYWTSSKQRGNDTV